MTMTKLPERKPVPRAKLYLSIDMDDLSFGHVMTGGNGMRLLVDDEQAGKLAALLSEHLSSRAALGNLTAQQGIIALARQLKLYQAGIHCNEQTPPAGGEPK